MGDKGLLNKNELKYFYDSRKKFDKVITDIMGSDIHLHDISGDQDHEINQIIRNQTKLQDLAINRRFSYEPTQKSKFDDFYNSIDNVSKQDKLFKQNLQLQEKVRKLQDDNKLFKHKCQLWEKTKNYIEANAKKNLNLKAMKYGSSDTVILEEFLLKVDQLLADQLNNSQFSEGHKKEEQYLKELVEEMKKKNSQTLTEMYKLQFQKQKIDKENELLKEKNKILLENRRQKFNEIKSDIGQKFDVFEEELQVKKKQNEELKSQLRKLQRQSSFHLSKLESLEHEKKSLLMVDYSGSIQQSKEEIKKLKDDNQRLLEEILKLKKSNSKFRKIMALAKTLNDEFLSKIQSSFQLQLKEVSRSPYKEYYNQKKQFQLKNSQFKFIKQIRQSRSCKKDVLRHHNENL